MDEKIKKFSDRLRETLLEGGAINDKGKALWTQGNFENLYKAINDNEKIGKESFIEKILMQLEEAGDHVSDFDNDEKEKLRLLMFEVLSLYYVFPSNISAGTKRTRLNEIFENSNLSLDNFEISKAATSAPGIGSGGMGYNTNIDAETLYLIEVFKEWYSKEDEFRKSCLGQNSNNIFFQNFLDKVSDNKSPQCRHVLLYLLFPDYYEHIISKVHKSKITSAFSKFIDKQLKEEWSGEKPTEWIDQEIKSISENLFTDKYKEHRFYDPELMIFWHSSSAEIFPDLDLELLEYKKQVVLYGPPGTSKTYTAKQLAEEIIRYDMAKNIGVNILEGEGKEKIDQALANNIHSLQLHPAYSYEDFIIGLQIKDGDTQTKKGYLLQLLDEMKKEPDTPYALILDEINRVDLSRLLGECFSALENRDKSIDLIGANDGEKIKLKIPKNLYIIGTMNLIDHSVEQLDFALRRRFLWIEASYNPIALLQMCKDKWEDKKTYDWGKVADDFERLVDAADNLNKVIGDENELGKDFVLGHVFFAEAAAFLQIYLQSSTSRQAPFLFAKEGKWKEPINKLWRLSLAPLLEQYLSGLDNKAQKTIMKKLKDAFKP